MDSTDPQTQQQQRQPPPQQQQQQPQHIQQQSHQPPPTGYPPHPMQFGYTSYRSAYPSHHQYPPPPPSMYSPFTTYTYSSWPAQASFTPASTVATTTSHQMSSTHPAPISSRKRNPATIKHPETKKEIDLDEELNHDQDTKPKQSSPGTNNTSTSVSNVLLQKVSENDTNDDNVGENINKDKESENDTNNDDVGDDESVGENSNKDKESENGTNNDDVGDDESVGENSNKDKESENGTNNEDVGDDDNVGESSNEDKESGGGTTLHYEPWQYSPISNRSGKKVYSKQFLLDVCEKICKIEIFGEQGDEESIKDNPPYQFLEKVDPFAPPFSSNNRYPPSNRQNDTARRQNQHIYMGRSSAGQERQRKIIPSSSLTQEVELKTSSNPWRPTKEIKEDAPNDVAETEVVKKKFRSILNKLTPNNFDSLSASVTNLNINTEAKLGDMIDIVFAKALAEPGYCVLYGRMCSHLKKTSAGKKSFGNTLLKRCQSQFQSDIYAGLNVDERKKKIDEEKDPEIKKQLHDELYEDMYRCRMRGLGLIKFIGELYKIEMLNDKIMFECISRLLSDTSDESLECLCDLLITIGEKLDRSSQPAHAISVQEEKKQQRGISKANAYQGGQRSAAAVVASGGSQQKMEPEPITTLDPVFDLLHKIRMNKDLPISLRIRFKLLDVCDLREKDNWQSENTKDNNPKKIEEIREAHKEKLELEKRQNAMGPRRSQEGRRGLGHSSGSSSQISSLANESSGIRGTTNIHASSSSHSIRDHSIGDNMKSNDTESLKEHQRQKVFMSNFLANHHTNKPSSCDLRPNSGLFSRTSGSPGGSSGGSLRPTTSTAASAAKTAAAAASTNSTATNAGTTDTNNA